MSSTSNLETLYSKHATGNPSSLKAVHVTGLSKQNLVSITMYLLQQNWGNVENLSEFSSCNEELLIKDQIQYFKLESQDPTSVETMLFHI